MAPKKKNTTAAPQKEEKKVEEAPAQKRKAEEEKKEEAAQPPKKEAKVEEAVEQEKDAPKDGRTPLKDAISFNAPDSTLNVVPTMDGKVLNVLTDSGLSHFIAGARANVGMTAGRYMFEVQILESMQFGDGWSRNRSPAPKQTVRLGFSTAGSSLMLQGSDEQVSFDADGSFYAGKAKSAGFKRFARDKPIAVLLNLDPKSPNKNTVSLFCDGQRISQPKPIPESLHGKTLFPHVNYRNVKLHVHMGPEPLKALPFKCRSIGGAAVADVVQAPKVEPKDGKYEVVMPVGFPDEGTFNWLDGWLEKNPNFVELSDRKIIEWAVSSGLWSKGWKSSNDKPEFNFGVAEVDNYSVRRLINSIAALVPRNYVVMEVKSNLVEADRKAVLQRFSAPHYKKVAHVVMGEPSADYKKLELATMLKEKQEKSDKAWHAKKAEKERKKQIAERQKQLAEAKKKAEEERKKKAEEEKKKKAEEAGEEKKEEAKEEEKKEEDGKKMEVDEEEKKDEAMDEEVEETEPPKVELTDEEKAKWFRKPVHNDLTSKALSESFANFSIPEKTEGFQEIRFEWQKAAKAKEYLQKWVLEKKRTARMDNLQPSAWFHETWKTWQKTLAEWQAKQAAFKASPAGKAQAQKKAAEKKDGEEDGEEKSKGDIFSVDDVNDVGSGEPLFKEFAFEDWALLQLRYELFLLQAAFKKDANDPDRPGIHESHFAFYFNKYYRKSLIPKNFGVEGLPSLIKLCKETVAFEEEFLTAKATCQAEDMAMFVKLGEENRRERQRRIDAGDETARLKVLPQAMPQPALQKPAQQKPAQQQQPAQQKVVPAPTAVTAPGAAAAKKPFQAAPRLAGVVPPAKGAGKGGKK